MFLFIKSNLFCTDCWPHSPAMDLGTSGQQLTILGGHLLPRLTTLTNLVPEMVTLARSKGSHSRLQKPMAKVTTQISNKCYIYEGFRRRFNDCNDWKENTCLLLGQWTASQCEQWLNGAYGKPFSWLRKSIGTVILLASLFSPQVLYRDVC